MFWRPALPIISPDIGGDVDLNDGDTVSLENIGFCSWRHRSENFELKKSKWQSSGKSISPHMAYGDKFSQICAFI
jgi:hypothetical protein